MMSGNTDLRPAVLLGALCLAVACGSTRDFAGEAEGTATTLARLKPKPLEGLDDLVLAPPAQCTEAKLAKKYQQGVTRGVRVVSKAWKRTGSCALIEAFVDSVLTDFDVEVASDPTTEEKPGKRCRLSGRLDGLFAALDSVQAYCDSKCVADGELIGRIEAIAYCNLVIDAAGAIDPEPWLRLPVGVCGFEFEVSCDAKFLGVTSSYATASGACGPYTQSPYLDIWNRSRLKSCDYYQSAPSTPE